MLLIVGLFGQAMSAPQEKGRESRGSDVSVSANNQAPAQVIDDLIVSRKAALDGVEYEEDGSLSLLSPTDYQAFKALNS
ncbi:MAG: hypothetical protein KBT89_16660, partial [Gammaproteobacteria bacterium]|nr:hypothetical protein [Gammaproteobacteria bacterium]